ncbi:MAG: hypothetical protein Q8942_07020 [Bacillota bacterium]|nr:hypothetical protein [Bacillota bacterium]
MNKSNILTSKENYLDQIRLNKGIEKMKGAYNDLLSHNEEEALDMLNSENLQFPTLFVLHGEIKKQRLLDKLNSRNKLALNIINTVFSDNIRFDSDEENHKTAKWMLETGYESDGLNPHYDELLDKVAVALIKIYNDHDSLRIIEKLIYNRYNRGSYIYDLVWAFFESRNPESIKMVVKRLLSKDSKDLELSQKLLGFVPCPNRENEHDIIFQYKYTSRWISENLPYLCYTGDHFQQTPCPIPFELSLENKYLQNTTQLESPKNQRSYTEDELSILDDFRKLEPDKQELLSNHSHFLHKISKKRWKKWINKSIADQIENVNL